MAKFNFSDDYIKDSIRKLDIHFGGWYAHLLNSECVLPEKDFHLLIRLSSCINFILNSFEPYGK